MNLILNSMQEKLSGAHSFRRRVSASHPDDKRNLAAAELLMRLATADHSTVAPDTLTALESIHRHPEYLDTVNETARRTGFRLHVENLDDFCQIVISKFN